MKTVNQKIYPFLEAIRDGAFVIDARETIQYMNRVMIAYVGEGHGRKCYQAVSHRDDRCPWCLMNQVFAGEIIRFERPLSHLNKFFDVIGMPLPPGSDPVRNVVFIYRDVTEKKKFENRAKTSEGEFKRLFDNIYCGVFVCTHDGALIEANNRFLDLLGYETKEELSGIDMTKDLYAYPKNAEELQKRLSREGRLVEYEVEMVRKDGSVFPVAFTCHLRRNEEGSIVGYEGIVIDLTERRRLERELAKANDFMNNIIMSSPNAIMAADMKGEIIIWNKAAEEILGYSAGEVIGKINIRDIYPDGVAREIMKMIRGKEYGGPGKLRSYPMSYERRDGNIVEGNLSAALLYDANGKEIATVGIFVDLKERLQMERKLLETQKQLFHSEKLASIGRLAAGVAHELNNPLGAIMMYGLLALEELSEDTVPYANLKRVVNQAERCKKIVQGLLDFSRQRKRHVETLDLNKAVKEIFELMEIQSVFQDIEIRKELDPLLPPIEGDKSQLQEVFINLALNAADAMEDGGILTIRSLQNKDAIKITFEDTGCGIPRERMENIFEPFFTTKSEKNGTGLGLSVSHGIIAKHGGEITVESRPNKGTTFTIRLPRKQGG
ncbi:MAG: PAS domain S-box protein [Deltaproteobacteria bacterium]|nr:PAS domain S-box protein [Deltaproteobacteria bacterium]